MKYEHQISWANSHNNNLGISIVELLQNGSINLIFNPSLHVFERKENLEVRTLY